MPRLNVVNFTLPVLVLSIAGCSSSSEPAGSSQAEKPAPPAHQTAVSIPAAVETPALTPHISEDNKPIPPTPSPYDALTPESRSVMDKPFTGDLDEMIKRRVIRAGVVYNRTEYYIDKGVQRGVIAESLHKFEDDLNKRLKTGVLRVQVVPIPVARNQIFAALQDGKVDFIAATLTVTPEREKLVSFSIPTRPNISEVVITSPKAPPVSTADDLSGREVFVRHSSSYYESLKSLNASLEKRGKPPVIIKEAPEPLEDDDLLEMVNAGLVGITIVDDYVAGFWRQVFPHFQINSGAKVRTGGNIAVGFRKNNPKILNAANAWIKQYGPRSTFGNMMKHRYLANAKYVKDAASEAERKKFFDLVSLFKKHGNQYKVDYVLMAAQGFQESRLDQSVKSRVGAIGVMQVMPATGKELQVGDITKIDPNIHAGVKYFRFMVDRYYKDEPMDPLNKGLMTLASYNAGPARIRQLRKETENRGLNPNVWFGNVEQVVSERIGRETVQYVGNIYKYYVAYKLTTAQQDAKQQAKQSMSGTN